MTRTGTAPHEVAAIIDVGPAPDHRTTFRAADSASANYLVNDNGDWDFSGLKGPVRVRLTIATPGVVFHRGASKTALSFADDPAHPKQAVAEGHHQFPGDVHHVSGQNISFLYRNASDGGLGDGARRCETSAYGIYFGDDAGALLHHHDPIIQNGGSS
jgi:hypothetical protein